MSRPQIHNLPEVKEADLIPARVKVRELAYITREENVLGDMVDVLRNAYGPGDSRNDPAAATERGMDPESQEYADLVSDYQKGQLVMFRPHQIEGLIASGAVTQVSYDLETEEEIDEDEELLDVSTASVDALAEWIREERPNVNDVVKASGGDPEVATRLLEAESKAQDGEPRKGVLEGLTAVISRG